jgi:hypothetical protein
MDTSRYAIITWSFPVGMLWAVLLINAMKRNSLRATCQWLDAIPGTAPVTEPSTLVSLQVA